MKRVSQVLQLPVIIKRSRPPFFEPQPLQELDFLLGSIAAEGRIPAELFEPRLFVKSWFGFLFNKIKFLRVPWGYSPV